MTSRENEAIGQAFENWVGSLSDETEGRGFGMLGDWLAVVSMVVVDEEGDPRVKYYVALRDGSMLPHVAKGLLYQGLEELNQEK
jgi:hypothetical protein